MRTTSLQPLVVAFVIWKTGLSLNDLFGFPCKDPGDARQTNPNWTWKRSGCRDKGVSSTSRTKRGYVLALTSIVKTTNHNARLAVHHIVKSSQETKIGHGSLLGDTGRMRIILRDRTTESSNFDEALATTSPISASPIFSPSDTSNDPIREKNNMAEDDMPRVTSIDATKKGLLTKSLEEIDEQRRGLSRPVVNEDSGWIDVVVKRRLTSGITPKEAHDEWLHYVWEKGGGLPVFVFLDEKSDGETENDPSSPLGKESLSRDDLQQNANNRQNLTPIKRSKDAINCVGSKRLLLPIGMEERICATTASSNTFSFDKKEEEEKAYERIQYKVTKWGVLRDIEYDTHVGTVTFAYDTSQSRPLMKKKDKVNSEGQRDVIITWKATCYATARKEWWQTVSEKLIADATSNFQAYLNPPWVYKQTTKFENILTASNSNPNTPADFCLAKEWVNYVWIKGGNIPLPMLWPVILKQEGKVGIPGKVADANNIKETNDLVRLMVPPFLKERLVSLKQIKTEDGNTIKSDDHSETEIIYTVDNPSIWTFYPVHSHIATVSFLSSNTRHDDKKSDGDFVDNNAATVDVTMTWEVQIRPYSNNLFLTWFAKEFTTWMVSTLSQNFASHIRGMNKQRNA